MAKIFPAGWLAFAVALAACGRVERPAEPRGVAGPSARETAQCHADLAALGLSFRALPDRVTGPGCAQLGSVQLTDIGVPVTGLGPVRCGAARALATWVTEDVRPAAMRLLGSELQRVDTAGSYACRNVVGSAANAGRRSGHALANAVDVVGFRLRDGRRVAVLGGWTADDEATREFLHQVRGAACRRFGTVLSPDYNAAHADHLHLEEDRAGMCR